jgi:hypothetical protein
MIAYLVFVVNSFFQFHASPAVWKTSGKRTDLIRKSQKARGKAAGSLNSCFSAGTY